jgi:hypothetical protein
MKLNLLLISADDFPVEVSAYLSKKGMSCNYARGRLKTKEIFNNVNIDAIIWLYQGHEKALANDLLKIFNEFKDIPLIMLTQNINDVDFKDKIENHFANIDLGDDLEDLLRAIGAVCNQKKIQEEQPDKEIHSVPHEIDFKNAVNLFIKDGDQINNKVENDKNNPVKFLTPWLAVNNNEKQILSELYKPEKKRFISKIIDKLKK